MFQRAMWDERLHLCAWQSSENGMLDLKGHCSVRGLRASMFNSVTEGEVERLAQFMDHFQKSHK